MEFLRAQNAIKSREGILKGLEVFSDIFMDLLKMLLELKFPYDLPDNWTYFGALIFLLILVEVLA